MKNLIIAIIVLIIAYLAYQQLSSSPKKSATAQSDEKAHGGEDQSKNAALASLISSAPETATVFFIEPTDGAELSSPISVKFGISDMEVVPAGTNQENSGHHHLLIDLDELPDLTTPLPATEQLVHFGGGQTETTIELSPGTHTLQLLLGNYLHIPHDKPVMSDKITITVSEAE